VVDKNDVKRELIALRDESRNASGSLFAMSRKLKIAALVCQILIAVAIGFFGGPWGPWLGLVSFLPALVLSAERMFASQEASGWHYDKRVEIDRLLLHLSRGDDPGEVWNRYLELDAEMAKRFPHGSWS
jgi:hypothetical protein